MSKKVENVELFPEYLVDQIENAGLSKTNKSHAYSFISNIIKKSIRENNNMNCYVEIPSTYFRKRYSGHYKEWLDVLVDKNIIYINSYYSTYINKCKSYLLNHYHPTYVARNLKTVSFTTKSLEFTEDDVKIKDLCIKDFKLLKCNFKTLDDITEREVSKIKIDNFEVDEQIIREEFEVLFKKGNKEEKYWMKRDKAIEVARLHGQSLIEDFGKYYVMKIEDFLSMKVDSIKYAYKNSIMRFKKQIFFAKRNSTNNRLDSNFTNMASCLSDYIFEYNNLVKLDLANAQFAILSDLFEKELETEDFEIFKQKSVSGTLYEYIQEKLQIKERKKAKVLVFELLFSKENSTNPLKKEIQKIFPTVVQKIDEFKVKNGYNNFSIMLQKRESEIFIDGLWTKIKENNLFCITKHDCLIVRKEDLEEVENFTKDFFKKINFKAKIVREKFGK